MSNIPSLLLRSGLDKEPRMLHLGLGAQRKNSPFFTIYMVHLKCFNPWNHKRQNCKWLKVIKSFWTYIIWLTFWKVSSIKKIQFVVDIKPYLQISSTSIFNAPHSTKHRDFLPAVDLSSWTLHAKLLDIQPHQIWRTLFFTRFFCQSNRIPLNWIGKMYILYISSYTVYCFFLEPKLSELPCVQPPPWQSKGDLKSHVWESSS